MRRCLSRKINNLKYSKAMVLLNPSVVLRWLYNWRSVPVVEWLNAAHFYRLGDFRTALSRYRCGLAKHPNHRAAFSARLDAAYCLLKLGKLEESKSELDSLVSEDGAGKEAVILLLRVLRYLGDKNASLEAAKTALRYLKTDPDIVAAAAIALVWASNDPRQVEHLRRIIFLARSEVKLGSRQDAMLQTALAYYEMRYGMTSSAERVLARVLASGLAPYQAILLKGELFLEQGRHLQARHQFMRAARCRVEDPCPWVGIARSYLSTREEDDGEFAVQAAEQACRLSEYRDPRALRVLVLACRADGRDSDAELYEGRANQLELEYSLSPDSIKEIGRHIERLQSLVRSGGL